MKSRSNFQVSKMTDGNDSTSLSKLAQSHLNEDVGTATTLDGLIIPSLTNKVEDISFLCGKV